MSSKLHDTSDGTNSNVHTDVKPGAGGVIENPNENDVLSGRGGRINSHPGNVKFRELVNKHKHQYLSRETKKLEKVKVADLIVQTIRKMDPPGRFLKEDGNSKGWIEIGDEKARKKAGQAMREKADLTRQELEHTHVKEAPGGAYAGYQAPMFHNSVPTNPMQIQNMIPMNATAPFPVDLYQQQMQIHMQMQHRYPIGSTDSSQIPFGQPGYPPPTSDIGFMQNGMPFSHDEDHQRKYSNSMSISSSSSMPPPANQNSLYQPNQISSLPESTEQKRKADLLKENMNAVDSLIRMRSSDTSFSGMSSFFGSENSSMLSQEQLLSLHQQQSMSMQDMPIEPFVEDTPQNDTWDPSDSTQDRRRMFRQNFSQLSSFNLPVVKDDQEGTSSDLMKESLLSFNSSGTIQNPSHHRRISTGEMAMSESSLNRLLETAVENSGSLLSFGTLPMTLESRFQSAPNTYSTSNPPNQSGPERYHGNANTREVYFDSGVNFESKRGLQEDAAVISQSRRSSVSTWLGEVEKIPGLRNNDMGSFRNFNDAGGSRLRLFSGQSYASESMRSIMSDISENMSALDLAHDYGVPQRRRSSQSNHLFQMT